jgi:hypothetical protein
VVLFWAVGVIPAGVITAVRGRWLLFFCGWLTLGILWFIGALAPDPEGPPRNPRWLLAPVAIVAAMFMLGVIGARPAPVLGLNGTALQDSVGNSLLGIGEDSCDPAPGGAWKCRRYDVGYSSVVNYTVKADWKGCWHAVLQGRPTEDNPKRRSGCVSLVNYVF